MICITMHLNVNSNTLMQFIKFSDADVTFVWPFEICGLHNFCKNRLRNLVDFLVFLLVQLQYGLCTNMQLVESSLS